MNLSEKESGFLRSTIERIEKNFGATIEGGVDDSPERFKILIETVKYFTFLNEKDCSFNLNNIDGKIFELIIDESEKYLNEIN